MFGCSVYMVKDKNNIKIYRAAESYINMTRIQIEVDCDCNYISLIWVSIHCKSKTEKQDWQAEERWWQNCNSATSHVQE